MLTFAVTSLLPASMLGGAAAIESGSGSNVVDYVAQDGSNNIAVSADVSDLAAMGAMFAGVKTSAMTCCT